MSRWLPRTVSLAVTVVVLGAACSGGGADSTGDAASTTDSPATTDAAPLTSENRDGSAAATATTATATPAPTTTASEAATTTAAASTTAPPDTGECLVGSWIVAQDQMNAFYAGLMTTVDAPIGIAATGLAGLTFGADGTYSWAPAFDLAVDVAGQSGIGSTTGSITGNWTAADGVVTASSEVNDIELSITVNGTTFSGSDLAKGLLNRSPVNGVTYSCAGSSPVLDFQTSDPAVTVPVTLTPA